MRRARGDDVAFRQMRTPAVLTALAAVVASACASSADAPESDTPTPHATVAARATPAASPPGPSTPAASATAGDTEATGVVGAVDEAAGVIEIRPTGGGVVTRIEVAPGARITLATGGSIGLEEIRPSDRIAATGVPGDTPDTLVASRITVSRVVPGAAPGG